MNRQYRLLFTLVLLFTSFIAFSQVDGDETDCSNGMDDGGDGFLDCFDADCIGNNACNEFFFGNQVTCSSKPNVTNFSIKQKWGSADMTANSHATPAVGDLDGDGIPEVVVNNSKLRTMTVLNGQNGNTLWVVDLEWIPENVMALARFDSDDDMAHIFVYQDRGDRMAMYKYLTETPIWTKTAVEDVPIGYPAFADFNQDGKAELYHRTIIRNAETGDILVDGSNQLTGGQTMLNSVSAATVAADFIAENDPNCNGDCQGLEIASGRYIYSVDIDAGTLTEEYDMWDDINGANMFYPKLKNKQSWTGVSIADYNQDGQLDVLVSGARGNSNTSQTAVFFWDFKNGDVEYFADTGNNHNNGTGRLNIADLDGDGKLNVNYVSNKRLYSLDENMDLMWKKKIHEGSSGFTGCTLFDFDDDGVVETIYRSESQLLIISGIDGSTRFSVPCVSRTQEEYPIVADVDGDGASEICVTCYTNDLTPFDNYDPNSTLSHVRVYGADAGESWQPSRPVWNQSSYFNVNVNDDLTIPIEQQNHSVIFSDGFCLDKDDNPIADFRALNSFMVQSGLLNEGGCSNYVTPNLELNNGITSTNAQCPETELDISFSITNTGDIAVSGTIPVSFYANDPTQPGSSYLNTQFIQITNLDILESADFTETAHGIGGNYMLYVYINDAGSTPPFNLADFNPASIPECDDGTNNLKSVDVSYDPFTLTVNKLNDNRKCSPGGDSLPDNGEAEAYFEGTLTQLHTIYQETFDNPGVGATTDDGTSTTPASPWSASSGSHSIQNNGSNNAFTVNNSDDDVIWTTGLIDLTGFSNISLSAEMFAQGPMEVSGVGLDFMKVEYFFYDDNDVQTETAEMASEVGNFTYVAGTASNLPSLPASTKVEIRATIHNNVGDEFYFLDNVTITGFTSVTSLLKEPDGFAFEWYTEDPEVNPGTAVVHTGSLYPTMGDDNYWVRGYYTLGDCYSDVENITIGLNASINYDANAFEVSSLTSCGTPNGAVKAYPHTIGNPNDTIFSDYTYEWRLASEDVTTLSTAPTMSNLQAGIYKVYITETLTGCVNSTTTEVTTGLLDLDDIEAVATPTHITSCGENGQITAFVDDDPDVGVTVNIVDYDFEWSNGTVVKATPDFTGVTYSGIPPGDYVVQAVEKGSGCPSNAVQVELLDHLTKPQPTYTSTKNTSCDVNGTGIITIDPDGTGGSADPADYTYEWYIYINTIPENKLPAASGNAQYGVGQWEMEGLKENNYTIVITEKATNCSTTLTAIVDSDFTEPSFNLSNPVETGNSLHLDNDGYISMTQAVAGMNAITISYWVNLNSENYGNDHRIFSSGALSHNQVLIWSDNTNGLSFIINTQSGDRARINSFYPALGWVNVVGTWDETTGDMNLYGNGVLLGSNNVIGSGGIVNAGPTMFIGRDFDGNTKKFEGELDEFRIYNKALTITEINDQMCKELDGTEDGLVIYYNFDDITGTDDGAIINDLAAAGGIVNGTIQEPNDASEVTFDTADINCPIVGSIDNTSCDNSNPNGQIDISSHIDPPGSYTYTLFNGFSTAVPLESNQTGIFTGLAGGFYSVSAEQDVTKCITIPATLSISDVPNFPSIFPTVKDDTHCDGATTFDGEIAVTNSSSTSTSLYTYEIFDGASFASLRETKINLDGAAGHTFTGLENGTYRIRVTDEDLTCSSFVDVQVGDAKVTPTFSSTTGLNNSSCGISNGSASVNITGENSGTINANYDFVWYDGNDTTDPVIAGENDNTLSGLSDGDYTVVGINVLTNCPTLKATITITDTPTYLTISEVSKSDQTDCGGGDGRVEMQIDDPTTKYGCDGTTLCNDDDIATLGFSYQWYVGSGTGGTTIGGNSVVLENVPAGTYTFEATDPLGCPNTKEVTIGLAKIIPVITLDGTTPNTLCTTARNILVNGGLETLAGLNNGNNLSVDISPWILGAGDANVVKVDGTGGYDYGGEGPLEDADPSTGAGVDQHYLDIENGSNDFYQVFTITRTVNVIYSGYFSARHNRNGTGSLNIYEGNTGSIGGNTLVSTTGNLLIDSFGDSENTAWFYISNTVTLPAGTYSFTVAMDNDVNFDEAELIEESADGTATFNVFSEGSKVIDFTGYTVSIYKGSGTGGTLLTSGSMGAFVALPNGPFTALVEGPNRCPSAELEFDITHDPDEPEFEVVGNPAKTTNNTICDITLTNGRYNGQITVEPRDGTDISDYSFTWYDGVGTGSPTVYKVNENILSEIPGGTYTVEVLDLDIGCTTTLTHTITNETTNNFTTFDLTADATATDVTTCIGGVGHPNGTITLDPINLDALPASGDYTFRLHIGGSVDDTPNATDTDTDGAGADTYQFTDLDVGQYTVEVVDNSSGCKTLPRTLDIGSSPIKPDFIEGVKQNNGVCDATLAGSNSGFVQVDVNDGSDISDYDFEWFDGAGTGGTQNFTQNGNRYEDLPGGTYTVLITNTAGNQCETTIMVSISNVTITPTMSGNISNLNVCEGNATYPNGEIAVVVAGGSGNYSYEWYFGNGIDDPASRLDDTDDVFTQKAIAGTASAQVTGSSTASISGLNAGMYTVRVLDVDNGCYAMAETFEVEEDINGLSLGAFTSTINNFSCDFANPSGATTANGVGATTPRYEWYAGTSATGTILHSTQAVTDLQDGTYTVKYIDDATGCFVTDQITINLYDETITLTTSGTDQTNCDPNGTATVDNTVVSWTPAGPPVGYIGGTLTYQWYFGFGTTMPMTDNTDPGNGSIPLGVTTTSLTGLAAGTYTVQVTDTESGCTSSTETVVVDDLVSALAPNLEFNISLIPTSCTALGSFQVRLASNPNGNTFDFEFYEGVQDYASLNTLGDGLASNDQLVSNPGTLITVNAAAASAIGGIFSDNEIINVLTGIYTIVVTDQSTGCRYQEYYNLPFLGQQTTTTITVENVDACPDNGVARVGLEDNINLDISAKSGVFEEFEAFTTNGGATGIIGVDGVTSLDVTLSFGSFNVGDILIGDISGEFATIDAIADGYHDGEVDDISEYILHLYAGFGVPADKLSTYVYEGIIFPLIYDAAAGTITQGDASAYANGSVNPPSLDFGEEATFHSLPAGPYIAIAREIINPAFSSTSSDQCWSQASFDQEIIDLAYDPFIDDFTHVPNSICDKGTFGGNGQLSVTVSEDPSEDLLEAQYQQPNGFRFEWVDAGANVVHTEDIFTNPAISTTPATLVPGDYTVTIGRAFTLADVTYTTGSLIFNEGETIDFSGGAVGVLVTDNPGVEMNIYITTGTIANGEIITGRGTGATGTVTGSAAGIVFKNDCKVSETYTVFDNLTIHNVVSYSKIDYDNCDNTPASTLTINDNDLEANGIGQPAANYTYRWFKETQTNEITAEAGIGTTNSIDISASGLTPIADTYYVVAFNTATGCATPPFEMEIVDNTIDPDLAINSTANDSSCDPDANEGNGEIEFQINSPELNTDYTFQLYDPSDSPIGTATASGILNGPNNSDYVQTITGLGSGTYTLEVIDGEVNSNTCPVTTTITINEESNKPTLLAADNLNLLNNFNCTPDSGFIEVLSVKEGTIDTPADDAKLSFAWVLDPQGANSLVVGVPGLTVVGTGNRIEGLAGGTYGVTITNTLTGCVNSSPIEVVIEDIAVGPIINIDAQSDDEFCNNTTNLGDGEITISIDEDGIAATLANYSITWYRGNSTAGADEIFPADGGSRGTTATASGDRLSLTGLANGDYTVVVEKDGTTPNAGCNTSSVINVGNSPATLTIDPTIAAGNISFDDNDNCANPNGFVELLAVSEDDVTQDGSGTTYALSDYTVTWEMNGNPFADPADGTLTNGANGTNTRIEGLDEATYTVFVTNNVTGCSTSITTDIDVDIEDISVDPIVQLEATGLGNDTYCDNTGFVGNGTLSIDISHDGSQVDNPNTSAGDYIVEWYRGTSVQTPTHADFLFDNQGSATGANVGDASSVAAEITNLQGLSSGEYTVYIRRQASNPNQGCDVSLTFEVPKVEDIPTLDNATISAIGVDNTICHPGYDNSFVANGSLTFTDADVSTNDLSDFEITVEKDAVGSGDIHYNVVNPLDASVTISDLEAGSYFVSARNSTTNCEASAIRVNIEELTTTPMIVIIDITDNITCAGGIDAIGEITVTADGSDETAANLDFEWFDGSGTGSPNGISTATISNLSAGTYTVRVRDNTTGCETIREYEVADLPDDPIMTDYEINNQTFCNSNGSFVLLELIQTGSSLDETAMDAEGYVLEVFNDSNIPQGTATGSPYEIGSLAIGDYYATIINNGSNCESERVEFEIKDAILFPVLEITVNNFDDPCSLGNGEISATADGRDDTDAGYQFEWFFYDNTLMTRGASIANASTISDQEGGFYEVEVTNIGTDCTINLVGQLFESDPIAPLIETYSSVDAFTCAPPDGSITISAMNQDTPQDYVFDLYDENPNAAGAAPVATLPVGSDPITFDVLAVGTYYILATHDTRGCVMDSPLQIEIMDISTPPEVVVTFVPNTRCDPNTPNGELHVAATDPGGVEPGAGYTFIWSETSGPLHATATGQGSPDLTLIPEGNYDLTVTNNDTGCETRIDTYVLTNESPSPLLVSVSSSGNSNCVNPNGKMAATVIDPQYPVAQYDYLWYDGIVANPDLNNPDYTGSLIEDLISNTYTLVVRDSPGFGNDICESTVLEVVVDDERDMTYAPVVEILRDKIYCYDEFVEGLGLAQVTNDDLGQYSISWTSLSNPADTRFPQIGFYADSLQVGNYLVTMTNLITGCNFDTPFDIIDATEVVPDPEVALLANNTNCTFPNGQAVASIRGASEGYLFEWFDQDDIGMTTILLTGSAQNALIEGDYVVRATNQTTGCMSSTTAISVDKIITDPTFKIQAINSLCLRSENGVINQFNGEAFIKFSSLNFVDSAAWFDSNGTRITHSSSGNPVTDGAILDLAPGDYSVFFRSDNGCTYDTTFSINTAVQVFNFVSANDDSKNDFFFIDCLDFFPDNNVKIFTRAGQRVYEATGYDNGSTRFEGNSDKGKQLPAGTYYYIIDKGDGSDLLQGFIELVR